MFHPSQNEKKNQQNNLQLLERLWGKESIRLLLVALQTGAAALEISVETVQKLNVNINYHVIQSHHCITSKVLDSLLLHRLLSHAHCCFLHTSW